jgi:hypothetical protein
VDKLRAVIARDFADASLDGVSADRRFATAYNAALQAAKMAIACAGYRVTGTGHHRISFEVVKLAIGKAADPYSDYFDRCRRKRNVIDYDDAVVATQLKHTRSWRRPKNSLRWSSSDREDSSASESVSKALKLKNVPLLWHEVKSLPARKVPFGRATERL